MSQVKKMISMTSSVLLRWFLGDEKDELIEENEEVEVEQAPFYERKENETSAKLSASTEVEEDSGRNDIIFKNEEF